ncbi:MAG: hypothetical protein ACFE8M_00275 [Candidatus Hermodarchaeota archaeon]
MAIVPIWDPLERFFWGIALAIALMCAIYFIYKARKREVFNEKVIMFGLSSLPLGFALSLTFTYFQVFQVQGTFINNIFYGDYNIVKSPYEILGRLSYISLGIGLLFFILAFDIIIKRTRYFLTIIYAILIAIEIILPIEGSLFNTPFSTIARYIFNYPIILGLLILVPLVLYLYTKWSHLEFKAVSSFLLFGFLLFVISLNLAKKVHKNLDVYPLILGPLLLISGCCITILPTLINPKIISRALTYWVLFAILTIPFLVVMLYIDIINKLALQFIIEFLVAFVYIYIIFFLIINNIKSEIISESREAEKRLESQVLGIFTRPQKVTEEEVIFHRERKICLVCKGKLLRSIYLCPECDALYCIKCSEALSTMENVCWACYTPIDPAKPVKLKEKDIEISKDIRKKL